MEAGLTIPRAQLLLEAYNTRRRRELEQLWLVIRHAYAGEQDNPQSILPAPPAGRAPAEHDDEDGFDAVAMVRRAQERR